MTLYISFLFSESNLNTNYNTYNQSSTFENRFTWNEVLLNDWRVNFFTNYSYAQNSYFNRSSKNTSYSYRLINEHFFIKPFILYENNSYYNTGLPEDSVSVNDKKIQRSGFGYHIFLLNQQINIQQENKYTKLSNSLNDYYGWASKYLISYTNNNFERTNINLINLNFHYHDNDIYLDRYQNTGGEILYNYKNVNNLSLKAKVDFQKNDIYSYNIKTDISERYDYLTEIRTNYFLTPTLIWDLNNRTNYKKTEHEENINRNNRTFDNELSYKITFKTDNIDFYTNLAISLRKRYLKSNNQDRESFDKKFTNGMIASFPFVDTLKIDVTTSLLQNFHSETYKFLDNDRYMNSYNLFVKKRIKNSLFINNFNFIKGQQVYIDQLLSANNHDKLSYIWMPEFEYSFQRNISLINRYQMRADYENFVWKEYLNDRFYRNLNCEWGINISKHNDLQDFQKNHYQIYSAFVLEHSETAEKIEDQWIRNTNEYQRKYIVSFSYSSDTFSFRFQPLLKYFNNSFESEFQTEIYYTIQDNLFFNITINPIGKQFNQMIWRLNTTIQYNF